MSDQTEFCEEDECQEELSPPPLKKRQLRRFRRAVKIARRLGYKIAKGLGSRGPGFLGKSACTCSCFLCGNGRKFNGFPRQEKIVEIRFREQMLEI